MARKSNVRAVIAICAAALSLFVLFGVTAHAAAPDFNTASTAAATSTLVYITPGAATTTLIYHSSFTGSDSAVVLTQLTASSTSSVLNMSVDYAQGGFGIDCSATPLNCDWYSDNLNGSLNSTTTPTKSIQVANSYSWTAASTARTGKAIEVPTPTRYVRVTYSMTGAAGGVWAQIVAKKQQPQ